MYKWNKRKRKKVNNIKQSLKHLARDKGNRITRLLSPTFRVPNPKTGVALNVLLFQLAAKILIKSERKGLLWYKRDLLLKISWVREIYSFEHRVKRSPSITPTRLSENWNLCFGIFLWRSERLRRWLCRCRQIFGRIKVRAIYNASIWKATYLRDIYKSVGNSSIIF